MNYKIPLFKLNFDDREQKAVLETIRSGWISMGPKVDELENKFSNMLRVKYSVAVTNCTAALHLAMILAGLEAGDEVICPSLTFSATVNAIRYTGAIPVFCDILSYDELTIDYNLIEGLINDKTKAIIVMHYGGFACRMDQIMEIAGKHNLKVIEDACHAPLSEYGTNKLGTIGDIGCFSFFSNKNISAGEGGMLVTNNREYYEKARLLRSHGMTTLSYDRAKGHCTNYDVVSLGFNYRMDDLRASIAIVQLDKLQKDIKKRIGIRNHYMKLLSEFDELIIPFQNAGCFSSNYIFPVILRNSNLERRENVRKTLYQAGIQTSVHYQAVHLFSIYRDKNIALPKTEYVSDCEISLPMYSQLLESETAYICKKLREAFIYAH